MSALPGGSAGALAIDVAGYPHLAELGAEGVTVRRSIDEASTWDRGTPLAAPRADRVRMAASRFNAGVEGATLTLAWQVGARLAVSRSTDGGLTFTRASIPDRSCVCDVGDVRSGGEVLVERSTDGAQTFIPRAMDAHTEEAPAMARADDGTLTVAWVEDAGVIVASSKNGYTWKRVGAFGGEARGVSIAAGTLGTAAVSWYERDGDGWAVRAASSTDGGGSFGAPTTLDGGPTDDPESRVALAADPTGGFIAVYATASGLRALRS